MPDLKDIFERVACLNGDIKEFIEILITLLYFENSSKSYIQIYCYMQNYTVNYLIHDNSTIRIFIENLCEFYQPRFNNTILPHLKPDNPLRRWPFCIVEKDYYAIFPTARERLNSKKWLKEILLQKNINIDNIEKFLS